MSFIWAPNTERDKDPKYVANIWSSSAMPLLGRVWWFDKRSDACFFIRNRRSEFRSPPSVELYNHPACYFAHKYIYIYIKIQDSSPFFRTARSVLSKLKLGTKNPRTLRFPLTTSAKPRRDEVPRIGNFKYPQVIPAKPGNTQSQVLGWTIPQQKSPILTPSFPSFGENEVGEEGA